MIKVLNINLVTPQGGDGGKGGDVILQCDPHMNSLSYIRKAHFFGNNGEKGHIKGMSGKNGKDIIFNIPLGTLVYEIVRPENYKYAKKELRAEKEYKLNLLIDMDKEGMKYVICRGGRGGIGNVTKKNIQKGDNALKGKIGEEKELVNNI